MIACSYELISLQIQIVFEGLSTVNTSFDYPAQLCPFYQVHAPLNKKEGQMEQKTKRPGICMPGRFSSNMHEFFL